MKSRLWEKKERPWGLHQLNTDQKKNPRVGKIVCTEHSLHGLGISPSSGLSFKYCSKSYLQFR